MDFEGVSILMGPGGPHSKLIYLVGTGYRSSIGSKFIFVYKSVLVITQGCIEISEHDLWIGRTD